MSRLIQERQQFSQVASDKKASRTAGTGRKYLQMIDFDHRLALSLRTFRVFSGNYMVLQRELIFNDRLKLTRRLYTLNLINIMQLSCLSILGKPLGKPILTGYPHTVGHLFVQPGH